MAHSTSGDRVTLEGWRCALGALVLVAVGACGGSGTGGNGGLSTGAGTMTATIDGQAFTSDARAATATTSTGAPGTYVLIGTKVTSSTEYLTLNITLYNIAATGTYPLGVTGVVFGGIGTVSQAAGAMFGSWLTPLSGASGTVTVTTLSSSRIVGTFFFTAAGSVDATSMRTVTNGSFDLPVTGSAGTLPANAGGSMTARINGSQWTAATVIVGYASGTLNFAGGTNAGDHIYNLNFIIGSVTGPGTYSFNNMAPIRTLTVSSGTKYWSSQLGGTGSVVVTDMTSARAKGSFTATLPPGIGTSGTLTIDNASFDVGLPQGSP